MHVPLIVSMRTGCLVISKFKDLMSSSLHASEGVRVAQRGREEPRWRSKDECVVCVGAKCARAVWQTSAAKMRQDHSHDGTVDV